MTFTTENASMRLAFFFAIFVLLIARVRAFAHTPCVPPDRGDLGVAYMRFDALARAMPKDPAMREQLNRGFDALTADFFAMRFSNALSSLARIQADVRQLDDDSRAEFQFVASHRFEFTPRTVSIGAGGLNPTSPISPIRAIIRVTDLDLMEQGTAPISLIVLCGSMRIEVPFQREASIVFPPETKADVIRVFASFGRIGDIEVARGYSIVSALDTTAAALTVRIAALETAGNTAPSALASLKGRCLLLTNRVDRSKSSSLLCDVPATLSALEREVAAAQLGAKPYAVAGDLWRVYRALGVELPTRQFVPEGDGPFPLVIAFHGAGADENMFFEGYGAGMLRSLAKEKGFALVCPPTIPFGLSDRLFERFLDEVALDMPIDRSRVLLLGHSLGAITASRLACTCPNAIAGAVCIAGFLDAPGVQPSAPRSVYLAELDPIFPAAGVRQAVESARTRGCAVELAEIRHEGHMLVVDRVLPQAVDWLLARAARTTATTKPTESAPSTSPMKTDGSVPGRSEASPSAGPMKNPAPTNASWVPPASTSAPPTASP